MLSMHTSDQGEGVVDVWPSYVAQQNVTSFVLVQYCPVLVREDTGVPMEKVQVLGKACLALR